MSKQDGHTPGPWEIHDAVATNVIGGLAYRVARCDFDGAEPCPEAMANARLVAAAPDLLTACSAALSLLGDTRISQRSPGEKGDVVADLRAAIAKARGE